MPICHVSATMLYAGYLLLSVKSKCDRRVGCSTLFFRMMFECGLNYECERPDLLKLFG